MAPPTNEELIATRRARNKEEARRHGFYRRPVALETTEAEYAAYKSSWETSKCRKDLLATLDSIPVATKKKTTTALAMGIGSLEDRKPISMLQLIVLLEIAAKLSCTKIVYKENEAVLKHPQCTFLRGLGVGVRLLPASELDIFDERDLITDGDGVGGSRTFFFDAFLPRDSASWADYWPAVVDAGFPIVLSPVLVGLSFEGRMKSCVRDWNHRLNSARRLELIQLLEQAAGMLMVEESFDQMYEGVQLSQYQFRVDELVVYWRKAGEN